MANAVRISDLPVVTSLGPNDRILVLTNPNTATVNVQTVLASTVAAVPVSTPATNPYTLQLTDGNSILYIQANSSIILPTNNSVPFAIGTIITIINGQNVVSCNVYPANLSITTLIPEGSGFSSNVEIYSSGPARLIKLDTEYWSISGKNVSGI